MSQPRLVMRVRFKSNLPYDEIKKIVESRAPEFEALPGLWQKYYLHDAAAGEYGGLYIWDSPEALAEFSESELRATIAKAYRVEGEPDVEVYTIFKVLRDDDA